MRATFLRFLLLTTFRINVVHRAVCLRQLKLLFMFATGMARLQAGLESKTLQWR